MTRRPLFHADWLNAVFLHFRVDAAMLQPAVPLELDRFAGDAFVSLVAFTQSRLRPAAGGRWLEWLSAPLARHEFLNLRAYVRHANERGIYFLAEWIPNRLATLIGPRMYGLPYRLGRLRHRNNLCMSEMTGQVIAAEGELAYRASPRSREFAVASPDSLEAFLLERYTAFTHRNRVLRRFDVAHAPWPMVSLDAQIIRSDLVTAIAPWFRSADLVAAHYSPGVYGVGISGPLRVMPETLRQPGSSKWPPAPLRSRAGQTHHIP